jgi:hypothetical protein
MFFAFISANRCAEAAAPDFAAALALALSTPHVAGGRLAETAALGVCATFGGGDIIGGRDGGNIFGGRTEVGGTIFGGADVGGDILGGRTAGHSTGIGDAVAGTGAADPLGFGPVPFGTGGAVGVFAAGGWCAEAAAPKLSALLFNSSVGPRALGSIAPSGSPEAEAASLASVVGSDVLGIVLPAANSSSVKVGPRFLQYSSLLSGIGDAGYHGGSSAGSPSLSSMETTP